MKNTLYLFLILLLTNCNDDIPLGKFEPQIVVYAEVSNIKVPHVSITKTIPLLAEEKYPAIQNAKVKITDLTLNKTYILRESYEGWYSYDANIGHPGHRYRLDIETEGKKITATEKMPQKAYLEGATIEKYEVPFAGDKQYIEIKPKFYDLIGVENYYQFIFNKQSYPVDKKEIFKDYGFDGLRDVISFIVEGSVNEDVTVTMRNITKNAYTYLEGVKLNQNQIASSPSNPVTNLTGGVLGYFNVYSDGGSVTINPSDKN